MNQDDDPQISELLGRWKVPDEVPNTFRSSVWSQIAARQDAREGSVLGRLLRLLSDGFARPAIATATAAVVLTFSLGAAHLHAESVGSERRDSAESAYLQSISPLVRIGFDGEPSSSSER